MEGVKKSGPFCYTQIFIWSKPSISEVTLDTDGDSTVVKLDSREQI